MKLHLLVATLASAISLQAGNSIDIAKKTATEFCQHPTLKKIGIKKSHLRSASPDEDASYYIFSDDTNGNYCIVSADNNEVMGYGKRYADEMPKQLESILELYTQATHKQDSKLRSSTVRENIPYFMDVNFNQTAPYNNLCPKINGNQAPTGCVATAMAQIMKYWRYPDQLQNDIPSYKYNKAFVMGQPANEHAYNWDNILNHYEGDTTDVLNNEIAQLMFDCGRSVNMYYGEDESGTDDAMAYYALAKYFGYNSDSLQFLKRINYYHDEWVDIIYNELAKKRPVMCSGANTVRESHEFVLDGYADGMFHVNWGWNGICDGYFDIEIMNYNRDFADEPQYGFATNQSIITGIVPGKGSKEINKPIFSAMTEGLDKNELGVYTNITPADNGFRLSLLATAFISNSDYISADNSIIYRYALGYVNEKNDTVFFQTMKAKSGSDIMIEASRVFDSTYFGKDMTFLLLRSKTNNNATIDSMSAEWEPSRLNSVTIKLPDSLETNPIKLELDIKADIIEDAIIIDASVKAPRPQGGKDQYILALVNGDDTLSTQCKQDFPWTMPYIMFSFSDKYDIRLLDEDLQLIVLERDNYKSPWTESPNFEKKHLKISDLKLRSGEYTIDSITVSNDSTMYKFEISFANQMPYETQTLCQIVTQNMFLPIYIPSNGTSKNTFTQEFPLLFNERYNPIIQIANIYTDFEYSFDVKLDTNSHIFYNAYLDDQMDINIHFKNKSINDLETTFYVSPYSIPTHNNEPQKLDLAVKSDTMCKYIYMPELQNNSVLYIKNPSYYLYSADYKLIDVIYKEIGFFGYIIPQTNKGMRELSVSLYRYEEDCSSPIDTTLLIAFTTSVDNAKESQFMEIPVHFDAGTDELATTINYKEHFSIANPEYLGLCKPDSSFYSCVLLDGFGTDDVTNTSAASALSFIAADGGVWISSDVEVPSLPIFSIDGKIVETVGLNQESSLFVPLAKGIYIAGGKKVLIK